MAKGNFKQTKGGHLTALDRKLINTSIANNMQDVSTKQKQLNIITTDGHGNYKAVINSYEAGIGIGSKKSWCRKQIEFSVQ
ncbi:hypothetical protein J2810_004575 [Chryseobacterium rhizosphaerae]|uniref:hypothetical protein n=1 Tax=Chryseobacterium rhizosphaerae TaxID=395937 RepID=UPI00285E439B|nr:hypothetical protein [Chryseobacterium rhizosphaerae]MDR6548485.1 hypothetical protein [Chryseobacterium rhizosphaerae]